MSDTLEQLWEYQANLPISKERFRKMLKEWEGKEDHLLKRLKKWEREQGKEILKREEEQWQRRLSEEAQQRYEQRRPLIELERADRREQLSLGQWIDELLAHASTLSNGASQSFEATPVHGSKPESRPPSAEMGLLLEEGQVDAVSHFYEVRLRLLARNLQREIDRHRRKPPTDESIELSAREQHEQRILKEGRGFKPHELAAFDRTAGHPNTVRRIRDRHGYEQDTGEPKQQDGD